MEIFKDRREKHGKHLNTEKYQSPIQIFGPRQKAQCMEVIFVVLYATQNIFYI